MNLFQFYIAEETGGALGEIIVALAVLAALAFMLLYVAYILLIFLYIIGIAAFLTGVTTATISFIRALTKEVKYLKQIRLSSNNPSQSIFLTLSDYDSLVRVLGDTFTFQLNLFSKILRNKKVLRFMLLFPVQTIGYTSVIVLSSFYFFFFGSVLLIKKAHKLLQIHQTSERSCIIVALQKRGDIMNT